MLAVDVRPYLQRQPQTSLRMTPSVQWAAGNGRLTWVPECSTEIMALRRTRACSETLHACSQAAKSRPETHVMWKTTTTAGPSYPRDKQPMLEDLHSGALAAVASESAPRADRAVVAWVCMSRIGGSTPQGGELSDVVTCGCGMVCHHLRPLQ